MQQIISLLMENKPGALMRVTGVLGQRGYNIESLTVARTMDPTLSRMTITVAVEPNIRAQVIKQMNKLINVLQATDVTEGPGVNRELILVRVRANQDSRTAILKEAEIFQARVVDSMSDDLVLEVTGDQEKLEEFISLITGYGAVEITRSGIVSMSLDNKKLRLSPPVLRGAVAEEALQLQETE
jgi:acetolactate synthase-1/3 small subunit